MTGVEAVAVYVVTPLVISGVIAGLVLVLNRRSGNGGSFPVLRPGPVGGAEHDHRSAGEGDANETPVVGGPRTLPAVPPSPAVRPDDMASDAQDQRGAT